MYVLPTKIHFCATCQIVYSVDNLICDIDYCLKYSQRPGHCKRYEILDKHFTNGSFINCFANIISIGQYIE